MNFSNLVHELTNKALKRGIIVWVIKVANEIFNSKVQIKSIFQNNIESTYVFM